MTAWKGMPIAEGLNIVRLLGLTSVVDLRQWLPPDLARSEADAARKRREEVEGADAYLRYELVRDALDEMLATYRQTCKSNDSWITVEAEVAVLTEKADRAILAATRGEATLDEGPLWAAVSFCAETLGMREPVASGRGEAGHIRGGSQAELQRLGSEKEIPSLFSPQSFTSSDGKIIAVKAVLPYDEERSSGADNGRVAQQSRVRMRGVRQRDRDMPSGFVDADECQPGWIVAKRMGSREDSCVRELVAAHYERAYWEAATRAPGGLYVWKASDGQIRSEPIEFGCPKPVDTVEAIVGRWLREALASAQPKDAWAQALGFVLGVWIRAPHRHRPSLPELLRQVRGAVETVGAPFPKHLINQLRLVAGVDLELLTPTRGGGGRLAVATAIADLRNGRPGHPATDASVAVAPIVAHQPEVDRAILDGKLAQYMVDHPGPASARDVAKALHVSQRTARQLLATASRRR